MSRIRVYIRNNPIGKIEELLDSLEEKNVFGDNEKAKKVFAELRLLAKYTRELGAYDNISLDLSLARGLDYYTGMIFEVVISGFNVGSLGGGKERNNSRWKIQ